MADSAGKFKKLRKYVLPKKGIIKRDLIFYGMTSLLLNTLFIYFFESFHHNYIVLALVLVMNLFLANQLIFIQIIAFTHHCKGNFRILKGYIAACFGVFFPFYSLYLYALAFKERKEGRGIHQLFSVPLSLCAVLSFTSLLLGRPANNNFIKSQLAPEVSYISQVGLESLEVFNLKNKFEKQCLKNGDAKCFQRKFKEDLFPSTNTGIILATAVDSLFVFKRKNQASKLIESESQKKALSIETGIDFLENQRQFVYENSCRRDRAFDFIGPISLISGPVGVYIIQGVDGLISRRFEETASKKLSKLSESMLKKDLKESQYRKVASLKTFYDTPSKRCVN